MEIRLKIDWELADLKVPPELFVLLRSLDRRGSLRAAAAESGVSYRHAWGLLQRWHRQLGQPLVHLQRGRGSRLSAHGQTLLRQHTRLEREISPKLDSLASEIGRELEDQFQNTPSKRMRIHASHGMAVAHLRDIALGQAGIPLDMLFCGSLDALSHLRNNECDIAGFHIAEGETGRTARSQLAQILDPARHLLIRGYRRTQGIMTAPANPLAITSLTDVVDQPVRFVNRQKSSGTRIILDNLLAQQGILCERIDGYSIEEFTHRAVAAMVASGAADCGFGLEAAAAQFGLGFIPCIRETYWFAARNIGNDSWILPAFQSLLKSSDFQRLLERLPGYESTNCGEQVELDTALRDV